MYSTFQRMTGMVVNAVRTLLRLHGNPHVSHRRTHFSPQTVTWRFCDIQICSTKSSNAAVNRSTYGIEVRIYHLTSMQWVSSVSCRSRSFALLWIAPTSVCSHRSAPHGAALRCWQTRTDWDHCDHRSLLQRHIKKWIFKWNYIIFANEALESELKKKILHKFLETNEPK